jgi:hypothetical protein
MSVFRQTHELWKALQSEKFPKLAPPCAVFVGGEPVHMQTVGGIENSTDGKLALRLDFNKHFECRVANATKVVANKKTLLETNVATNCTIALTGKDEMAFLLESNPGATVSIVETLPVAPKMLSPVADVAMTDLAAMFRWCAIPMVVDYEIQMTRFSRRSKSASNTACPLVGPS